MLQLGVDSTYYSQLILVFNHENYNGHDLKHPMVCDVFKNIKSISDG